MHFKFTNFYINIKIKKHFLLLFILTTFVNHTAASYKMSIEGGESLSDNSREISIYIESTSEDFELTSYQCAISFNQDIDLSSLSFSYQSESSDLVNQPNLYVSVDNIDGIYELTFVSYIGNDIITKSKKLVGKFIIQANNLNSIDNLNLQWNFEGTVSTILTGKDFVNITNPANHVSSFSILQTGNVEAIKLNIVDVIASNGSSSALNVVDGKGYNDDENSKWAVEGMPASLIFDLGKKSIITKTRFSFFYFAEGRIYLYNVKVSNDMENWTTVLNNVYSKPVEWTQEEFSAVEGRYLKLEFLSSTGPNGGNWATLWEAEIYGTNSSTSVDDNNGEEEENSSLPSEYSISQNYPNPFNPTTKVDVSMKEAGNVRLTVYNLLGEKMIDVLDGELSAGVHEVNINASNLPSGIYIYKLDINNNFTQIKKMNLIK